ncbi:MAG TPA: copper resistance protein CopC [Pseudonocardiaceae bacterium]|jgi:methionine-rich copper-binding protein CopC
MQLPGRRAGLIVAIVLIGGAVLGVLLLGRPAGATLSTASPPYDAHLATPPAAISLTFSTAVAQAHVDVSGAVTGTPAVTDQRTVTVPVTITAAGRYLVAYHVITTEGGELSGTLPFTVGDGSAAAAAAGPSEPASAHHHGQIDRLTAAVIAVNLLVVLVLGALFVLRGRRRTAR